MVLDTENLVVLHMWKVRANLYPPKQYLQEFIIEWAKLLDLDILKLEKKCVSDQCPWG
jgi:hypothetical protein